MEEKLAQQEADLVRRENKLAEDKKTLDILVSQNRELKGKLESDIVATQNQMELYKRKLKEAEDANVEAEKLKVEATGTLERAKKDMNEATIYSTQLSSIKQTIDSKEASLISLIEANKKLIDEMDAKKEELTKKESDLYIYELSLNGRESTIIPKEEELAKRFAKVEAKEKEVEAKENAVDQRESALEGKYQNFQHAVASFLSDKRNFIMRNNIKDMDEFKSFII